MYAFQIAEAFRGAFNADPAFTGVTCHNLQSGDNYQTPILGFECKTKALNSTGSAFTYTLHVWVESNASRRLPTDPEPGGVHGTRVDAVRAKLLGAGKAALLEALQGGIFDFRNWSASESDMETHLSAFRTPVTITGTCLVS